MAPCAGIYGMFIISSMSVREWKRRLNSSPQPNLNKGGNLTSVRLDGLTAWERISVTSRWFGNTLPVEYLTQLLWPMPNVFSSFIRRSLVLPLLASAAFINQAQAQTNFLAAADFSDLA